MHEGTGPMGYIGQACDRSNRVGREIKRKLAAGGAHMRERSSRQIFRSVLDQMLEGQRRRIPNRDDRSSGEGPPPSANTTLFVSLHQLTWPITPHGTESLQGWEAAAACRLYRAVLNFCNGEWDGNGTLRDDAAAGAEGLRAAFCDSSNSHTVRFSIDSAGIERQYS